MPGSNKGKKKHAFLSHPSLCLSCHPTKNTLRARMAAFSSGSSVLSWRPDSCAANPIPAPGGGASTRDGQSPGTGQGPRAHSQGTAGPGNESAQGSAWLLCGLGESLSISEPQLPHFNRTDRSPHAGHQVAPLCLVLLEPAKPSELYCEQHPRFLWGRHRAWARVPCH